MATRSPFLLPSPSFLPHPNPTHSPLPLTPTFVRIAIDGAVSRRKRTSIAARAVSLESMEEVQAVNIADDVTQVELFPHICQFILLHR